MRPVSRDSRAVPERTAGHSALPSVHFSRQDPAMRIERNRRGDYAVRASLALVVLDDGRPVSARRIAERMSIPPGFLAHVLTDLVRAGIVVGTPGRSGGYRLAAPAHDIDLLRIVDAVEDQGKIPQCVIRGGTCRTGGTCAVHAAFETANAAMRHELAAANLAEIARYEPADRELSPGRVARGHIAGSRPGRSRSQAGVEIPRAAPEQAGAVGTSGPHRQAERPIPLDRPHGDTRTASVCVSPACPAPDGRVRVRERPGSQQ